MLFDLNCKRNGKIKSFCCFIFRLLIKKKTTNLCYPEQDRDFIARMLDGYLEVFT